MDNQQNVGGNPNLLNEFEKLQLEIENINKYFNQLIEKEQKMRLVLQNQQMLNAKHKFNVDQIGTKPLYSQMIGSSVPEKSSNNTSQQQHRNQDQTHDHLHDQSNNLIVPPANPRNAGGQHSHQISQYSSNSQNVSPLQYRNQNNIQNQNEEENKQQQMQNQLQQQYIQQGGNQFIQNDAQQGPQQTFGNEYQSQVDGMSYNTQNQLHGGINQLDKTQIHVTNKPSLQQDQLMQIQQQLQQQQNPLLQEFYGWQVVEGQLVVSNPLQAAQLVEQMFLSQQGVNILKSNQQVQKFLTEKENLLKKQYAESQQKFLKNNSSQELKNAVIQKDEEIKKLNQTINTLKEQVKDKSNEIELWKSKALNLSKTNQNGNSATLVYDQEIKKLSLVVLNQQKEIEEWKNKALKGGIANTLDGNTNLPPASQASGSERIAQQRALLLYIEVERLKKIIEKYKEMADNNNNNNNNNSENVQGGVSFNNAVNNVASKKRSIFTDNNRIFGQQSNVNNNINNQTFSRANNNNNNNNNDDPDIQNLRRLLESKIQEVDEWRMKFAKLAEKAQERDQLEQEVYRLKETLEETLANNGDNRGYRSQAHNFEGDKVNMLQIELQKAANALKEKIAENEQLRMQQLNLNNTVKNTNMQVQQFTADAQGKNQQLTGELGKVTNVLKDKLKQNEELRGFMMKLESMIKEKQFENQQLVQRMQQMQTMMLDKQQFSQKVQQYETTIHNMRDEFEKVQNLVKDKIKENEVLKQNVSRAQQIQNHKEMIETEMRKFQQALEIKARECEEWKLRCKAIEQKLQQASQIEARAKDSEYKLRNLIQEIQLLPQRISKI